MSTPRPGIEPDRASELLLALARRFERHPERHPGIRWAEVCAGLESSPQALYTLAQMERTGGEPDVVGRDPASGTYLFADCAPETPAGRRSLCYDDEALRARKKHPPTGSAVAAAAAMGATLLTEGEYRALQELGEFDLRTSSWLLTPPDVRARGGALFGDRRYGRVFTYHNGADSYYAARGFRCMLRVADPGRS